MAKKILVIDDSALMRRVISDIINESNEYEVAAIAKDGLEGLDMIVSNPYEYSAVILDINMPKLNGLELLQRLQKDHIEQTVIVVSTVAREGAKETIQALEYGAFDFVTKPENYLETKSVEFKNRIFEMLNVATNSKASIRRTSMSKTTAPVKKDLKSGRTLTSVISHTERTRSTGITPAPVRTVVHAPAKKVDGSMFTSVKTGKKKIVALACSTGGPKSLQQVIPMLPAKLDAGVVLVQHMPEGFTKSMADRLNEVSPINVKEAADGDVLEKGTVYIAPGGKHMEVKKTADGRHKIQLNEMPPIGGLRPCANITYDSLRTCGYDEVVCVVLTGMGADGTNGILSLAKSKPVYVIAQNAQTCVVYGMPKAIVETGMVNEVVPLTEIAQTITKNVGVQ